MGPRSTAVLCTSVVSWVEAGLRKAAIASSVGGFRAGAALGIEPVISSVAGGSLPLVTFRSPKTPNTRMASPATPSRVRWPVLLREWEFYSAGANSLFRDRQSCTEVLQGRAIPEYGPIEPAGFTLDRSARQRSRPWAASSRRHQRSMAIKLPRPIDLSLPARS